MQQIAYNYFCLHFHLFVHHFLIMHLLKLFQDVTTNIVMLLKYWVGTMLLVLIN